MGRGSGEGEGAGQTLPGGSEQDVRSPLKVDTSSAMRPRLHPAVHWSWVGGWARQTQGPAGRLPRAPSKLVLAQRCHAPGGLVRVTNLRAQHRAAVSLGGLLTPSTVPTH